MADCRHELAAAHERIAGLEGQLVERDAPPAALTLDEVPPVSPLRRSPPGWTVAAAVVLALAVSVWGRWWGQRGPT